MHDIKKYFTEIAPRYDITNRVLSGYIDIIWRKKMISLVKEFVDNNYSATLSSNSKIKILDGASGSGDVALMLQNNIKNADIVAFDFCEKMLELAKQKGVKNIKVGDLKNIPYDDKTFDVITVAYGLRNITPWEDTVKELLRVLKNNGKLYILDFGNPPNFIFRKLFDIYLRNLLPIIGGFITGKKVAYRYLVDSIEKFPSGEEMKSLIKKSGATNVDYKIFTFGISYLYVIDKM